MSNDKRGASMDFKDKTLNLHLGLKGKIEVISRATLNTKEDLSLLYSPGVAYPCLEIAKDAQKSYLYTRRHQMIAVITDGSAVLGLGDIGAQASMPVMEGKAILFKTLADVDAFPICIDSKDINDIVKTITLLQHSFGGINLEDISAPRCFEIEEKLKKSLDIPVFHDDQHGTAIVVGAALINALKLTHKSLNNIKVVINGIGAAGQAITRFLLHLGVKTLVLCDRFGILSQDDQNLRQDHKIILELIKKDHKKGTLTDALDEADVFIGVSAKDCLTSDMIKKMKKNPIIFAMANPDPEILPNDAYKAGAFIVGTGSSKYENQINNVLAFPGIFKGTLDAKAKQITLGMMEAACHAIARYVKPSQLSAHHILPNPLDLNLHKAVSTSVYYYAITHNIEQTH